MDWRRSAFCTIESAGRDRFASCKRPKGLPKGGDMVRSAVVCASLFLAAAPLPALAEGHYVVRNDTSRALTCGLRRENRSVIDRFVIRSGQEWRQTSASDGMRVLLCDCLQDHAALSDAVGHFLLPGRGCEDGPDRAAPGRSYRIGRSALRPPRSIARPGPCSVPASARRAARRADRGWSRWRSAR